MHRYRDVEIMHILRDICIYNGVWFILHGWSGTGDYFRFTMGEQMPRPVIVKTVRRVSFKASRPYCFTAKGFEGFVYSPINSVNQNRTAEGNIRTIVSVMLLKTDVMNIEGTRGCCQRS